jgi:hypothetical protein
MTHRLSLVVASFVTLIPLAASASADVDPAMIGTWETSGVNSYGNTPSDNIAAPGTTMPRALN